MRRCWLGMSRNGRSISALGVAARAWIAGAGCECWALLMLRLHGIGTDVKYMFRNAGGGQGGTRSFCCGVAM